MVQPQERSSRSGDVTVVTKPSGRRYMLRRTRDGGVLVALLGPVPLVLGRAHGPAEGEALAEVDERLREWKKRRGPIPREGRERRT